MLHILNISPEKTRLMEVSLKVIARGDALVLMAHTLTLLRDQPQLLSALSALMKTKNCELYGLVSDCQAFVAAGLEIREIDYPALVALAARHPASQTWF